MGGQNIAGGDEDAALYRPVQTSTPRPRWLPSDSCWPRTVDGMLTIRDPAQLASDGVGRCSSCSKVCSGIPSRCWSGASARLDNSYVHNLIPGFIGRCPSGAGRLALSRLASSTTEPINMFEFARPVLRRAGSAGQRSGRRGRWVMTGWQRLRWFSSPAAARAAAVG